MVDKIELKYIGNSQDNSVSRRKWESDIQTQLQNLASSYNTLVTSHNELVSDLGKVKETISNLDNRIKELEKTKPTS